MVGCVPSVGGWSEVTGPPGILVHNWFVDYYFIEAKLCPNTCFCWTHLRGLNCLLQDKTFYCSWSKMIVWNHQQVQRRVIHLVTWSENLICCQTLRYIGMWDQIVPEMKTHKWSAHKEPHRWQPLTEDRGGGSCQTDRRQGGGHLALRNPSLHKSCITTQARYHWDHISIERYKIILFKGPGYVAYVQLN